MAVEAQGQSIPLEELRSLAAGFASADAAVRMSIAHDPTILPVGKILNGKLIDMNDGAIGLQTQIDDFISDFRPYTGPGNEVLLFAESPFVLQKTLDAIYHSKDGIAANDTYW